MMAGTTTPSELDEGLTDTAGLSRVAARGALASFSGQAASFAIRFFWIVVIARLVTPEHFGLIGMVTAFTGLIGLFREVGLASATVQQVTITQAQLSALFWINLFVGGVLAALTVVAAPLLAAFYSDQRLVAIALALAVTFVFYGAAAQYRALLQRRMQITTLTLIETIALVVSVLVGIGMGLFGFGYWALVGMTVCQPLFTLVGVWRAARWTPDSPRTTSGIRSMLRYGGVVTLNGLVTYVAYNLDKALLGRVYGAEALGLYGRGYHLVTLPTEGINSTLSGVMFPALSRVRTDPVRLRRFFLRGYGLFLAAVVPVAAGCALFAEDIVMVVLGPAWGQVVPLFRLLSPTVLAFALINPMGPMLQASGHAVRSLNIAFLVAPTVVVGYLLGLARGPEGVALGFSVAMLLLVPPVLYWATRGTVIRLSDLARPIASASISTAVGATVALLVGQSLSDAPPSLRLAVVFVALFVVHLWVLARFFGQREVFVDLIKKMLGRED